MSTDGHSPAVDVEDVEPGLGARLAGWTLDLMSGTDVPDAALLDAHDARRLARVRVAVDAIERERPLDAP